MRELIKVLSKKSYILLFFIGLIYSVTQSAQSISLAYFATSPLTVEKIFGLTIAFIILELIQWGSNWLNSYYFNICSVNSTNRIFKYYFGKIEKMTSTNLTQVHTGYIENLIRDVATGFVDIIWHVTSGLLSLIIGVITFFIMACTQSVITGIICIVLIIIAIITKYILMKRYKVFNKEVRAKRSESNATIIDFVQNIITVKKLNIREYCMDKIERKNEAYLNSSKKYEKKRQNMNIIFHLTITLIYVVVLISTIVMVREGKDALPYLLFYMNLLGNIYGDINSCVFLINGVVNFNIAKKQLDEKIGNCVNLELIKDFEEIELKDAKFKYNENSTEISIPDFTLRKGDKISIMGESGQGKTTAMNILSGLYELSEGSLLIDGIKNNNSKLDLVFVSQEVDLFDMSIRENLCLGKEIPESEILKLFEDAGLIEWYNNLENGLDTLVGEKGIKLSVGQKQRLNLIRGILINKDLYFFDEPTSNLDTESEQKITAMIDKYLKDKTYVIVTHRPKLKKLCNKHYIMENHILKKCELKDYAETV